jgi:phenylalanyl-tRNA synthetase beta subunit
VVDKNLMVGEFTKSIQAIDKNLIKEVNIFDIFILSIILIQTTSIIID